jgi:ribonuclease D
VVSSRADLLALLDAARASGPALCAIDTEADSLHRYRESLCLVQFAHGEVHELIDPLAIDDLTPLAAFLAECETWMHGADYDMTMLQRELGVVPRAVWDTQIGARLLGFRRFGLADLVDQYFGVVLSKSSQKADWGKRPLSEKMVEYALNDVRYLLPMGRRIEADLAAKGRYPWFVESCEAARRRVIERDDAREEPWRIQGSGRLDRRGLAFLRALWQWRDQEAKVWDRPCFMVAPNKDLIAWSIELAAGRKIALPRHFRSERRARLLAATDAARESDPASWPERLRSRRRKRDPRFEQRLDALIRQRNGAAEAHDLDPSLIAPRSVLESLAAEESPPQELLLEWQRGCLGLDA